MCGFSKPFEANFRFGSRAVVWLSRLNVGNQPEAVIYRDVCEDRSWPRPTFHMHGNQPTSKIPALPVWSAGNAATSVR